MNGTWTLAKLVLRRERFIVPLWLPLLISLAAGQVKRYATGIPDTAAFAREMAANQALTAFAGEIPSATLAGMAVWKNADAIYTILGLIMILTVVRHSRGEEESGRAEMVGAGVVGPLAPLTAALAVACGSAVLAGLLTTAAMTAVGADTAGSLAFGAAITAAGLVFAGMGAVAAQLTQTARAAIGVAAAGLGLSYVLRFRRRRQRPGRAEVVLAAGLVAPGAAVRGQQRGRAAAQPRLHRRGPRAGLPAARPPRLGPRPDPRTSRPGRFPTAARCAEPGLAAAEGPARRLDRRVRDRRAGPGRPGHVH